MVKWVRDFHTLPKRTKLAVACSSVALGAVFQILLDRSMGYSLERSIASLLIVGGLALVFVGVLKVFSSRH